jgi:general secretion pathway protein J
VVVKDRGGFTLIELLVAFAIFSVIVSALYGTFFVAHRAVRYTEDSLLRLHEMRSALLSLRRELEAAVPGGEGEGAFVLKDRDIYGRQASRLSFETFGTPLEAAARVSYYALEEEGTGRVSLYKKLHHAWEEGEAAREAEVLEEIESFSVEINSKERFGEDGWLRTWDDAAMPGFVRITISAPVGEGTVTLTETVRPVAGGGL